MRRQFLTTANDEHGVAYPDARLHRAIEVKDAVTAMNDWLTFRSATRSDATLRLFPLTSLRAPGTTTMIVRSEENCSLQMSDDRVRHVRRDWGSANHSFLTLRA